MKSASKAFRGPELKTLRGGSFGLQKMRARGSIKRFHPDFLIRVVNSASPYCAEMIGSGRPNSS
ncbi:MAG: hypothetical protein ACJ72Z_05995, partial [Pyrinomonadaceae bacterium]